VLSFVRQTSDGSSQVVVVLNLTPVFRQGYRIGFPRDGFWREVLNSDASVYGGGNQGNLGGVTVEKLPMHNQGWSAPIALPPLAAVAFKREG